MRNRNDRSLPHLLPQHLLDPYRGLHVNTRRRLIQDNHSAPPQHRSFKAHELSLALGETATTRIDSRVERPIVAAINLLENRGAYCIAVFGKRVEILAHSPREEDGFLG